MIKLTEQGSDRDGFEDVKAVAGGGNARARYLRVPVDLFDVLLALRSHHRAVSVHKGKERANELEVKKRQKARQGKASGKYDT